jgi:D-alanine--poly(phosphoribitol) ligase subunit 1
VGPNFNAAQSFFETALTRPDAPAIVTARATVSYGWLAGRAPRLAAVFAAGRRSARIGILATRSVEAYLGIIAAAWSGATYVPLNLKWPEARLVELLGLLDLDALVVDANGEKLLTPAVRAAAPGTIVVPEGSALLAQAGIIALDRLPPERLAEPLAVPAEHPAYIIFTSGTTGVPKGVVIASGSLQHYLDQTEPWARFAAADRIAECCDVTFDLTVHNMFLAWRAGSALHLMSQLELMAPARFIRSHEVTVWLSVPTIAATMRRLGSLRPAIFPSLRLSIFCGEPLPVAVAQAWQQATPNGVVENIYGPTEATVVCMRQTLTTPPIETDGRGTLAVGDPYATMTVALLDEAQRPVARGQAGEIALSGPQLAIGYFDAPTQTADRFRMIEGRRWYLTGDLGRQDEAGAYHHLGRIDNQVKLKGNRIELEEVDAHLRKAAGTDTVATVAWPVNFGSAEGLVGFCSGTGRDAHEIRRRMRLTLPDYMVPGEVQVLDRLPLNINGKVDRKALRDTLAGVDADPLPAPISSRAS